MTEPITPKSRGVPSAQDIQAAWESVERPTSRTMETAMRAAGWDVSASSIMRCVNSGFKPRAGSAKSLKASNKPKPIATPQENVTKAVQAIAPADAPPALVAAALVEALRNLPDGERDRVKALLAMDEQQIVDNTRKLYLAAGYLLAEDLAKHTTMMMLAPDKAAKLYQALGSGMLPVVKPPLPAEKGQLGDGAIVVEQVPTETRTLSTSAQAIRDFRTRNNKDKAA